MYANESLFKLISLAPKRNEPPIFDTPSCSGKRAIMGCFVSADISVEFDPSSLQTLLPKATAANWNPKQIPRNGIFFSSAKLDVLIIPSDPRVPNPPGTKIP